MRNFFPFHCSPESSWTGTPGRWRGAAAGTPLGSRSAGHSTGRPALPAPNSQAFLLIRTRNDHWRWMLDSQHLQTGFFPLNTSRRWMAAHLLYLYCCKCPLFSGCNVIICVSSFSFILNEIFSVCSGQSDKSLIVDAVTQTSATAERWRTS